MSVCASANPFNSRPVTTAGRRPALANDERWVALNKNIFQDILNAILIQTTFSSASAGKRHLSTRPDVSLHSPSPSASSAAASPLSFTASDASATPNPIGVGFKESKDGIRLAFDSIAHDVVSAKNEVPEGKSDCSFPCEAAALQGGRSVGERETFSGRGNERHPASLEVKEQPLKVSGSSTASGDVGQEGSKGVGSEIVCASRRRDNMSSAFSKVGAYDPQSVLNDSHLSVYCEETYVGKVPMMIIGLRPYHSSDAKLSCLLEPTNQISLHSNVLKKCPTEISANSGLDPLKSHNANSSSSSSLFLTEGRRDQYDRCAKMTGKFLPPQPTDQLHHINTAGGGGGGGGGARNGQKFFRSMYYPQHHSENAHEPNGKSSLKMSPAEVQPNCDAANASRLMTNKASSGAPAGKDLGRKSSRDHSILTILGLLSSTDDHEDSRKKSSGSKSGGGEASEGTTGLDKNRLLGIGVTVIGRSRWMAVDKCIVYDMIDQVLNGERDYFSTDDSMYSPPTSRCDVSRPQVLVSPQMDRRCGVFSDGRKRAHHLPRTQRTGSTSLASRINTTSLDVKRKMEYGIEGDLKQNHDMDLLPSSSSSSSCSSSSSSFISPTTTMSSSQERPINFKPARAHCESPTAKDRLSSSKSLEGVSVLRSLLSDDPVEVCQGGSSTTEAMTPHPPPTSVVDDVTEDAKIPHASSSGRVKATDFSKMIPVDELRRVKRSRHNSVADGKKRRVNASGHPSTTNEVLLPEDTISSSRSCSVPASAASTMPDRASKSSNSIKWKSSMLMRMRTEEGHENDEEGNGR